MAAATAADKVGDQFRVGRYPPLRLWRSGRHLIGIVISWPESTTVARLTDVPDLS